jgi:hypothetical protein
MPRRINFIILTIQCLDTYRRKMSKKDSLILRNLFKNNLNTRKKSKKRTKKRKRSFRNTQNIKSKLKTQNQSNIQSDKEQINLNIIGIEKLLL